MAHGFEIIEHTWIPMPDRVRLSVRLWLPERAEAERIPAVLELIPYRKRDAYREADDAWGAVLAGAGIAFARVDVRGTGDSEGVLTDEYSEAELIDGEACIAWLATRNWCNGSVGMRGISWGGINTLMIAARRPPALKAIVPMAAADNRFTDDAHYIGGRIGKPNLDWGVLFKTVLAGPPDPEVVGDAWEEMWQTRLESTPAVVTEWLRHQSFDAYWQRGSVCLDPSAISCPVYLVAGWQDTYVNFVGSLLASLAVPVRALIGPWGHTYPGFARPQSIDWANEEVSFWRRWLLGETEAVDEAPRLLAYLPEQTARQCHPEPIPGTWRRLDRLPDTRRCFRLESGVLVAEDSPAAGSVDDSAVIRWTQMAPVGFATAEWLDRLPEEQSRDDEASLCFDTAPLTERLTMLGRASLTLGVSENAASMLTARLCDVDEDGHSWLVSYASLEPGSSAELEFRLAGHVFMPGHRLRISISGGLWPMTWPARVSLDLALEPGSCRFEVPVLEDSSSQDEVAVAEVLRKAAPPAALSEVLPGGTDCWRYETSQPAYEYVVESTGTRLSGEGAFVAELGPGGASSWQVGARRGWRRADWDCAVEAEVSLQRIEDGLLVEESLKAYRGDRLVFERRHSERVSDPDSVGAN